ncbi:MAG: hypothetical protein H7Y06_11835 [Opitutaceae bacterium]|nr:hypothetical protein [Opitutaceae bacterium]
MTAPPPTPTQRAYLDYIAAYLHAHRCAPSEADMQHHFGVTAPGVHSMVLTLERRGFIRRISGQARSITLVPIADASAPLASATPVASHSETTMPAATSKKCPGWTDVRPLLAAFDKPALLALVKDLYAASETARDLVNTRCAPAESGAAILEKARHKIVEQFFPSRGFGKLKLGEARKAIRDYRKTTGSIPGTAELLMTYVENGARFTREYGDIDERFYSSVESALTNSPTSCAVRLANSIRSSKTG